MTTETLNDNEEAVFTLPASTIRGTGRAYGTVAHLVSGATSEGVLFASPLPLQAVSTIELRLRPAKEFNFKGLDNLPAASEILKTALSELGVTGADVLAKTRSMVNRARKLNSREADEAAAVLALYDALELPVSPNQLADLLSHASGGSGALTAAPYRTMVLASSAAKAKSFPSAGHLSYCFVTPKSAKTREGLLPHPEHDALFEDASTLLSSDAATLASLATRSAALSNEVAPHLLADFLFSDLAPMFTSRGFMAPLGVAVDATSHTGALLFDASPRGRQASSAACHIVFDELGSDYWVSVSTSHKPQLD